MSVPEPIKEVVARRIAGEIILSNDPGATMRKWREIFRILQTQLADELSVAPSVISDYEGGRRRSPGTKFVKRFVKTLIAIDESKGGYLLRDLARLTRNTSDALVDIREYSVPMKAEKFCKIVDGIPVAGKQLLTREIYGYTVIDSIKAISTLSGADFYQIFGSTTERALIFTNVTHGRSPMVAVRVHHLKPRMVIIHGPEKIDELAIRLADIEQIPLILSKKNSLEELLRSIREYRS
jgi:putative transcriptional regulator